MISEFPSGGIPLLKQPESEQTGSTSVVGQQFLRFHLQDETTALLSVHQIAEVLSIPVSQVVPIPDLPGWVMGVYNWRGEILWILDLGYLVGFSPLHQQGVTRSSYNAIVIHSTESGLGKQRVGTQISGRKMLGLVVNRVEDMEWCNPDLIQSPPESAVNPELVPFLRGYWIKPSGEMSIVLHGESIVAGMGTIEITS